MILQKETILKLLLQGQDCAFQLLLLQKSAEDPNFLSGSSCDDLLLKILTSFTDSISSLAATPASDNISVEVCSQNHNSQVIDSGCSDDRRSLDSGQSTKRPSPTTAYHSRGSYKKKKNSISFTKVSPILEDGHAWRKYGQKDILNAKYPRSYFRCTHKYDQGCKATKQVQRKEDDLNLYLITYFRNHTCCDSLKIPQNNNIISWEYSNYSSTIKEETTISDQSNNNVLWNCKEFLTFGDQPAVTATNGHDDAVSFDNLARSIDLGTHGFQYLDESEINYL